MSNLEKIIEAINLPKTVVEKADKFLSTLLGSAVRETGELITDKIRFRRFRNQILILQRAEDLLSKSGLKATEVSLKTLVPLIEKSSLEEDPTLQDMWATLLANASVSNAKSSLHAVCINVLSSISPLEAKILARAMELYEEQRAEAKKPKPKRRWWFGGASPGRAIRLWEARFTPWQLYGALPVTNDEMNFLLDNLLRLKVLDWEAPLHLDEIPKYVHWTSLGFRVISECTKVPSGNDDA